MPNAAQLALIHVAKKELSLGDDEYRLILDSVCGVSSAKDIRREADVEALLEAFKRLGFKQQTPVKSFSERKLSSGYQAATEKQIYFIEAMWQKITKFPQSWQESLNNFLQKRFHIQTIAAINRRQAANVIETFREMLMRAALCQASQIIKGDDAGLIENQLLDLYSKTSLEMTHEESTMIMAVLLYKNPALAAKVYQALDSIRDKLQPAQTKT
jgi:phage gp16-like protein